MLKKIVSDKGRILSIIKLTTKYDIPIISSTTLQARTEIITEKPDNNLTTILKNRVLSSELSNVSEDFESITVNNNNNIKEP